MADTQERPTKIKQIIKDKTKELQPGENVISRKLAAFWKEQIEDVDTRDANWYKKGAQISKRYRDERNKLETDGQRKFNILWTNTQIMIPALYSNRPIANIDRTFLDRDPVGRLSARMLERSVRNEMEDDTLHDSVSQSVLDYLLVGRGQTWARYEPEIGQGPSIPSSMETNMEDELNKIQNNGEIEVDETPEEEQLEGTNQQLLKESAPIDYMNWKDFLMFPAKARTWREVQAVGKRLYISKEEAIERFGEEIGREMRPDTTPMDKETKQTWSDTAVFQDLNERSIVVYEIWNKTDKRVYWISTGYDYLCDVRNDPLQLKGFFPCPKPLVATYTNDTVVPVPDFWEWQDQAIQIDELTQRIAMLARACKVAGTYDAANGGLRRLLNESVENQLIPVDNWAIHADRGGVQGSISFLPLKEVQETISTLQEVRRQVKQDLDEITGLSDILRGTTDSRETLGGLRLKNNNAGTRLSQRQRDVARFARDNVRLIAEIQAKHFSDETLIKSSGILYEDELQPDFIEEEQRKQVSAVSMQGAGSGAALPGAQPSVSAPGQQAVAPGASLMDAEQQGNNVVPFPGGNQGVGASAAGAPSPQQLMSAIPTEFIIADKVQKALDLLRNDIERGYRIDIETDSTVFGDQMQERADATEFITAITAFIGESGQLGATLPEWIPLASRFLQFSARKYKAGRDLEAAIDDFASKMRVKSKQLIENPPPDPEMQKVEAELKMKGVEHQMMMVNDQRDYEKQAANDDREAKMQEQDDIRKAVMEQQKQERAERIAVMEMSMKERELQMQQQISERKFQMDMEQMDREAKYRKDEHEMSMKELTLKSKENEAKRQDRKLQNKKKNKVA